MPTCSYRLIFYPYPMCLSVLLTMHDLRANWFPASWFSPRLLFLSRTREYSSWISGFTKTRPVLLFLFSTRAESTNWPEDPMSHVDARNRPEFICFLHCFQGLICLFLDSFDSRWSIREQQKIPKSLSFSPFWWNYLLCSRTYSRGYRHFIYQEGVEPSPGPCFVAPFSW